ncbi:hypothetical protein Pcinc_042152 [Petrolisthes cinctipes]|uniref:Ig-like domain-containing protein n=1 Tax=Petrolisthes cinctipes TaxID=88211 RepID=A0AAE1BI12_PETCI|nr:hypothetical protein Pcinc_042152 [Petrolisthes cinctipes]
MGGGGKQTVECINKGLNTIPNGIDPGTQVLDITGNSLVIISHEKFKVMELTNLQRIYVSRCKLVQLDDAAFRGLTNLVELDLSYNELPLVPVAALEHVPGLMRLQLSNNPITKIRDSAFSRLQYLTTLEITSCDLQTLEPRAFQGLDQLQWLKLDNNKLRTVPHNLKLPSSLHGIALHNNPWNCDCKLKELRSWLVKHNVPSSIEPKCSSPPRLVRQVIKDIHPDDFACPPEVRPTSLYLDVMEGKNVSFECHVTAVPGAQITWRFNDQPLENSTFVYDETSSFWIYEEGISEDRVSHLRIEWVTDSHAGIFQCMAENKAGLVFSNFTLRISRPPEVPEPQDLPEDYLLYIGVALVALVVLVIILLIVLAIRCCRRRSITQEKVVGSPGSSGNGRAKDAPTATNMPKYIQMGTPAPKVNGVSTDPPPISVIDTSPFRTEPPTTTQTNPDLINDAAEERSRGGRKRVSLQVVEEVDAGGVVTTRRLDDIMEEFEEGYDPSYDHLQQQAPSQSLPYPGPPRVPRDGDGANPYPLTEIPPPEDISHTARFYDTDGFPVDYGLPRNGTSGMPSASGVRSVSYNPLPTPAEEIPMYATVRRNRHSIAGRTELQHDQKYPEDYHPHHHHHHHEYPHPPPTHDQDYPPPPTTSHDGDYHHHHHQHQHQHQPPAPDSRYPQASFTPASCEFCPPPPVHDYQTQPDPAGRIGGDGCSFDNLLSSCGGSQCCYAEQGGRVYDNSLPDNYRPLDPPKPPPPEGWGDEDPNNMTNGSTWCDHPDSPGTRVLYSPDEGYVETPAQQPPPPAQAPQGTQV